MAVPVGSVAIDDCLSIRDGHLWMEGCDTVELARTFGTPIHVLSEDQLRRNVRRTIAAFRAAWPEGDVLLLPSIKANYTLALRRILTQEGTGCDTFGPGELEAALRTGVPPETISVNGSVKAPELIARAVDAGCRITLDSVREIELVRQAARDAGRRAVVRFRVRPDYDGLDTLTRVRGDRRADPARGIGVQAGDPDRGSVGGRPRGARCRGAGRGRRDGAPRPAPPRGRRLAGDGVELRRHDRRALGGVGRLGATRDRRRRRVRVAARSDRPRHHPRHAAARRRTLADDRGVRRRGGHVAARRSPTPRRLDGRHATGGRARACVPRRHGHPPGDRAEREGADPADRAALGRAGHDGDVPARRPDRAQPLDGRRGEPCRRGR